MFCSRCGSRCSDSARFCFSCGNPLLAVSSLPPPPTGGSVSPSPVSSPVSGSSWSSVSSVFQSAPPPSLRDGRYAVLKQLGAGGMGRVFLTHDNLMDFRVVIKEMLPFCISQADLQYMVKRFMAEAKLLFRLKHPRLPRVSDCFVEGGSLFLIMDYVEGEDLQRVAGRKPGEVITVEESIKWMKDIIDILKYLHNQNPPIIHRDIKPSNIMLTPQGDIFLVDFGLARPLTQDAITYVGTPGFASPENFGGVPSPSSDLFSLGATFHFLLTAHHPRYRKPFTFPPLSSYRNDIPKELEKIIKKMLNIKPEKRYATPEEVLKEIEKLDRDRVYSQRVNTTGIPQTISSIPSAPQFPLPAPPLRPTPSPPVPFVLTSDLPLPTSHAHPLSLKTPKNTYYLLHHLAEGDYSDVFLAEYEEVKGVRGKVCIKIATAQENNDLLLNEIEVLQKLQHKSLPILIDSFITKENQQALITSFIDGYDFITLREKYPAGVPQEHLCWIFQRLLSVVGFMHKNKVLHCNIEPGNILVRPRDHNVFLMDFVYSIINPHKNSRFKGIVDNFSPPEAYRQKPPIPPSDLFMLGMSMFYIAGGDPETLSSWVVPTSSPAGISPPSTGVPSPFSAGTSLPTATSSIRNALEFLPSSIDYRLKSFIIEFLDDNPMSRAGDAWKYHQKLSLLREEIFGKQHQFLEFVV